MPIVPQVCARECCRGIGTHGTGDRHWVDIDPQLLLYSVKVIVDGHGRAMTVHRDMEDAFRHATAMLSVPGNGNFRLRVHGQLMNAYRAWASPAPTLCGMPVLNSDAIPESQMLLINLELPPGTARLGALAPIRGVLMELETRNSNTDPMSIEYTIRFRGR